jgi:hypothetical protein
VLVPADRADEARELLEADDEVDVDESDGIDEDE